jgi:hypothetical protein
MKVSEYFNPEQHLTFHQDKEGNMIGGGYQVNNLMYQNKMPLFISLDDANLQHRMTGGSGGSISGHDDEENKHYIPEKFSDLFRDLAIPAGLFMMPALFKPRNYEFEVPERNPESNSKDIPKCDVDDTNSDTDTDDEVHTKTVTNDIFDTLLSLVTPSERIQHDVKTRRRRYRETGNGIKEKKGHNRTRRSRHS